jgi:ribonuclease J
MNLTIHRGTHEIGGSCIELVTDHTRMFLDFGLPLVDREGKQLKVDKQANPTYKELVESGIAPSVPYFLERDDKPTFLLLSHSHQDHYGLAPWIPDDIPVYASKGTKKLLEVALYFNQSNFDPSAVITMESWKPIQIGDFTITPYRADHSAVDAFSFLIVAEGKRIFYSGDLRSHGRKGYLFENLITNQPHDIDYLILEGSTLGRDDTETESEQDIEDKLVKELSKEGLYLASFSSQNVDRFVSFFKACIRTHRTLVVDPYTAHILDSLKELFSGIPQHDWKNSFRVFNVPNTATKKMANDKSLFRFKHSKITIEEMQNQSSRLVVKENYMIRSILKNKGMLMNATDIYSMWDGYLKGDNFWLENGVPVIKINCSGHAYREDLVKFVEALNPKRVIPNHTFHPEAFGGLFGEKALLLQDGQALKL